MNQHAHDHSAAVPFVLEDVNPQQLAKVADAGQDLLRQLGAGLDGVAARFRLASLCVGATRTKAGALALAMAAAPGAPWSPTQLGRLVGLRGSTAGVAIKRLVRDGSAVALGEGKYTGAVRS